ncbi:hypothetical protein DC429_05780 [Arthrobacter sp. TPD3018]|nr:hypothetical protein DC425_05770 [Sphingomonas sp. TPD3009]PVE61398.1 hypothetical protein DC429_05780 [Arthrobacter sp. TPD3018]PVE85683.1 hypothetical protein DC431_07405 [Sphingomonas melonis]
MTRMRRYTVFVIPAEAGIQMREACGMIRGRSPIWIPAFAGMTVRVAASGVCSGVSPKLNAVVRAAPRSESVQL